MTRSLSVYIWSMRTRRDKKVKRLGCALALLFALLLVFTAAGAAEKTEIEVFFARGAMDGAQARALMEMTRRAFPQAEWTATFEEETGESLRARILSDSAPQMAVCGPGEAAAWAKEGLLAPLEGRVADLTQMQRVVDACTWDEQLVLAPIMARHRQMAVNRRLMERERMGYMTGTTEHPVWYPSEFDQVLEAFALSDTPAVEIWPSEPENSAGIEAMVQAIFGGSILSEDGRTVLAGSPGVEAGLTWLSDRVDSGLIGVAESREQALERFLAGETALFIDWSDQEAARHAKAIKRGGVELKALPYPSACGLPVRSFELTGVCVFATGGAQQTFAEQAVSLWSREADQAVGDRAIWQDDAVWLPVLHAGGAGATLRSLLCDATRAVLAGEMEAREAMRVLGATMEAMKSAGKP